MKCAQCKSNKALWQRDDYQICGPCLLSYLDLSKSGLLADAVAFDVHFAKLAVR